MRKLTMCIMTSFLMLTIIPMQLKAEKETTAVSTNSTKPVESAEANAILARLNEIKAMDFSKLSSAERKELRKELRQDRDRLRHGGGIYLTVGALLIVILLLILLL